MIKTKYILTTISCGLLVLASAESIKVEKQTPIIKSFTKKIKVCKETARPQDYLEITHKIYVD